MKQAQLHPQQHIFICTNTRSDQPFCSTHISEEDVNQLKSWALVNAPGIIITKTKCIGLCHKKGGVMCIYPKGEFYQEIRSIEEIKDFITQKKNQ